VTIVGFIGLGTMGSPMAVNMQHAGYRVRGYNRSPEKTKALVEAGGTACASIAEAVEGAEFVCLMVPDTPDVEEILRGEGGVFQNAAPGTLIIDFSSIRPDVSRQLAKEAEELGLRMVDAPVSGGEAGAKHGVLSVMVGGSTENFDAARDLLCTIGATVIHVGPNGSGQTVKAANQLVVGGTLQLVAEAIVFLEAHGVDIESALEVLGSGLAGSRVLEQKRQNMVDRNFEPGFRLELHQKDMGIVTAAAWEAGVVRPLGGNVAQLMAAAVANGLGQYDHSVLLKGVERLSGRYKD
jgi:2-hydroxy-3-oxopropionate reductase